MNHLSSKQDYFSVNEDHWPVNHLAALATLKIRGGVSNIHSWMTSLVSQPSQCLCRTVITEADTNFQPTVLYGNDLGTWGQKQPGLVNSEIYTSQRHRHHQELCKGNSIRPMIISCLKKLKHYQEGKYFLLLFLFTLRCILSAGKALVPSLSTIASS